MRTEEETKPSERYLFADEYFSDRAIAIWQSECIKRCRDKPKGAAYEKYINWVRRDNEIAVFTLYAYADFAVPKRFDTIFQTDNPNNYIHIDYELTQAIHEAWFPSDHVGDGHKHLCVFKFEKAIPDIFKLLHRGDQKFYDGPKGQIKLGFCNSKDFSAIKLRIENVLKLKQEHGSEWWKFDVDES